MYFETNVSLNKSNFEFNKIYRLFFILLHVVYSLDFGFIERRTPRSKLVIQILTVGKCVFNCVAYLSLQDEYRVASLTGLFIYTNIYLIYFATVLSFSYEASFFKLQSEFGNSCSYIEAKVFLVIASSHSYSTVAIVIVHWLSKEYEGTLIFKTCLLVIINSLNTVYIICFFMFYIVYCRLREFVASVKQNGDRIFESLDCYKAILDAVEKTKKYFDIVYSGALAFQMPLIVDAVYLYLRSLKGPPKSILEHVIKILNLAHMVSLLYAPAISAGLTSSKADELKLILLDRLLTERNEPHSESITLFIDYMNARPMDFKLFKIVPLDWTLPVILTNLCITYQIVIVQFTHLY